MRVSPRPLVSAATSLAVAAGALVGAMALDVVQAPPAGAAATLGDYCGSNGTYGTVQYENGVSGSLRCVIIVATSETQIAQTYTPPSEIAAIGYGFWYIEGGGGGGGAREVDTNWMWGLSGSNGDALTSSSAALGTTTILYVIGRGGVGGYRNGIGEGSGAGQTGYSAWVQNPSTGVSVGNVGQFGGAGGSYNSQSASKGSSSAYYCPDDRIYWTQ